MVESMSDARTKAILLIAHGSRRDEANQDLVKLGLHPLMLEIVLDRLNEPVDESVE